MIQTVPIVRLVGTQLLQCRSRVNYAMRAVDKAVACLFLCQEFETSECRQYRSGLED